MMWSDKAFGIWMGHAGEDARAFTQDEPSIDARSFEETRVLAVVRRDVMVGEAATFSRSQLRDCESEGLAA